LAEQIGLPLFNFITLIALFVSPIDRFHLLIRSESSGVATGAMAVRTEERTDG
jgi:hypothetical protein